MAVIGKDINKAIALLEADELIGLPTETVYGLAGNALSEKAVAKIFEVKNRPTFDPLIVHTSSFDRVEAFVKDIPDEAYLLAEKFMPGPLTLLLPKKEIIPDLVTAALPTVAIRIPNHGTAQALLQKLDFPLAAPSANPFGYISPTTAQHVDNQLGKKTKYVLDGGACEVGIESSIIGFFNDEIIVYRKGGLALEEIEDIVGKVKVQAYSSSNPQAPGMLKSHYAPKTPFYLSDLITENTSIEETAYLAFQQKSLKFPAKNQLVLSETGNLREAAQNLFSYMRILDNGGYKQIFVELLPEIGLGRAINDRIVRATTQD